MPEISTVDFKVVLYIVHIVHIDDRQTIPKKKFLSHVLLLLIQSPCSSYRILNSAEKKLLIFEVKQIAHNPKAHSRLSFNKGFKNGCNSAYSREC